MEGIKEKLLKSRSQKSSKKYLRKSWKWKILQHKIGDDSTQKDSYIDVNQTFTRCGNHPNILPLFGRLRRSLTSLLSSLRDEAHPHLAKWSPKTKGWERDASHNSPMVLFIAKTKILECPYGLKWKLQLMKGSLVRIPLRRTRRHQTDRLLLHFHMISTMMPRAPHVVAPSLVLRQNLETLALLASRWSKPLDIDVCPHTIFIRSSVFSVS
jgi:hypothetical protein